MRDEQLQALLRNLPTRKASPGFTSAVMTRLERPTIVPWWSQPALVGLTALGLILLLVGIVLWTAPARFAPGAVGEQVVDRQRVLELRTEYEILEEELQELRLLSAESGPLVGVRGDDGVDYLVDLRELISPAGRALPTSYPSEH